MGSRTGRDRRPGGRHEALLHSPDPTDSISTSDGSGIAGLWARFAVFLVDRAGLVTAIAALISIGMFFGVKRLDFATNSGSYLNSDDPTYLNNVQYQKLFGGDAMLTVISMNRGHTVDELVEPKAFAELSRLHDKLSSTHLYRSVITPLTALEFSDALVQGQAAGGNPLTSIAGKAQLRAVGVEKPGSAAAAARQKDATETLGRINAVPPTERTIDNPEWAKVLLYDSQGDIRLALRTFFPDKTHAQIIVRLKGNLDISTEADNATIVQNTADQLRIPHASTVTTGASMLLKDLNNYLRGGMLTLGGIAVAVMIAILLLLFNVRWRLLPLLIVAIGILWAFGLAGFVGIPLTIVTIGGLPVMLGIGIDYAIQNQARITEEVANDRGRDRAIIATARGLGPALLVVTFDAIFAFMALQLAKVPMIRDFGLLLAVGIAVICLVSIIGPLVVLGARERRSPTPTERISDGALGHVTKWLGSVPTWMALPLVLASIGVLIGGLLVEGKLTIQTDPVKWLNQNGTTVRHIHRIEAEVGGANEIGVFVQSGSGGKTGGGRTGGGKTGGSASGVFNDATMSYIDGFARKQLALFGPNGSRGHNMLLTQSSVQQVMSDLLVVPNATRVQPTGSEVEAAWKIAPEDIRAVTATPDGRALNIVFRTGSEGLAQQAPIVAEMSHFSPAAPPGTRLTPSGLGVVGVGLLHNIRSNRVLLIYLSMLFVFLFLCIRLRSVIRAFLSMVPVGIAVGTAALLAWALELKLSPMTAVGGPIVVAACTEFTSLILLRFVEERGRGHSPRDAMAVTAGRTGRAFIVSACTAVAGVAVLSLSSLPLLRDFGRIVALNVVVALISALVVLPPLLRAAEHRNWVTRGLIRAGTSSPTHN